MSDAMEEMKKEIVQHFTDSGVQEKCGFEFVEEMVPMRDGVKLQTLIYLPKYSSNQQETYPVLLQRTPYPFLDVSNRICGEEYAKRGFAYVCQYCRGQMKSEGDWEPYIYDRNDGIDLADWISKQPWAGNIGVFGASYGSYIGWAMADEVKDKVKAMYLEVFGADRFMSLYEKRAFRHDVITAWAMGNAGFPITADYIESCKYMPHVNVDTDLWGRQLDWYRVFLVNETKEKEFWQQGWWKELREMPEKNQIPIYMVSGWYDHHHGSTMSTWQRLNEVSKKNSILEVGGWNHGGISCIGHQKIEKNMKNEQSNVLRWFEQTLVKEELPERKVRFYNIGKDEWREFDSYEEIHTECQKFYLDLSAGKKVLADEASQNQAEISYVYNPDNPVMSHGGESMLKNMQEVGSLLQPEADWRDDVLSFISEPLKEEMTICGRPKVYLWVKSDCEDTAFTAKLMEVHEDGEAYNIRSSITTIGAECEKYVPGTPILVCIDMWEIMFTLQKGSKLRLDISSSDFPQYNIHSNYPGNWAEQTKKKIANQVILTGGEKESVVCLPILK